jgi:hypothetical protein
MRPFYDELQEVGWTYRFIMVARLCMLVVAMVASRVGQMQGADCSEVAAETEWR